MADLAARLSGWSTRRKMLLAVLGGAVTGLGQAPFSLVWLALIGIVTGFLLFRATSAPRKAAWVGWAFGVGYFALVLNWIIEPFLVDIPRHGWMAPFALIGMAGGMALFWGAAFWLARRAGHGLALAVFWTGAEVLRTYVLTGFPWGLLGYIWLDTGLDQLAAFIGPHGLTLVTLAGVWALLTASRHKWRLLMVPTVVLPFAAGCFLGGYYADYVGLQTAIAADYQKGPIVRLIQPNAPQHQKWDPKMIPVFFDRSLRYTAAKAEQMPDVVIWPETAIPYLLNRAEVPLQMISDAAGGVPVVAGIQRRGGSQYFNSLAVIAANGVVADVYDKAHLVPFGEYVPGGRLASALSLKGFAAQEGYGYGEGEALRLLDIAGIGRALPMICYEAIFPHEVGGVAERPDLLLQITNDAWFGQMAGPQQHLAQARFRAIEQGLPMVRAANTGVSAVIDARGGIKAALALGVAGYLDVELPHPLPPTLYARSGDLPVLLLLVFAAAVVLFKRRRVND